MARKGDGKRQRTAEKTGGRAGKGKSQSAYVPAQLRRAPGTGKPTDKPITLTPRAVGDSGSGRQSGRSGNGTKPKKRPQPGFGW